MRVDPEELVELKNHGPMKLRCAVARAMLLVPGERRETEIRRQREPSVLKFRTIRDLATVLARSRRKPKASQRSGATSQHRSRQGKKSSRRAA
jgi:hypothetical protein